MLMSATIHNHWQETNKKLLAWWDNSTHHKHIETYSHQLHYDNSILPSYQISCEEILKVIEDKM